MWQKSLLSVVRGTLSSWFEKTIQEFEPVEADDALLCFCLCSDVFKDLLVESTAESSRLSP